MYEDLQNELALRLPSLNGDWVGRNAAYEAELCTCLGMNHAETRYWDATWRHYLIEFKKGRSIWLDLVRYSEILLSQSANDARETLNLFFVPNASRGRIQEVICVETRALIDMIRLDVEQAKALIALRDSVPRSLNAQASLTVNDVKRMASFVVE